ncbi:MAG: TPM domain-containing protein [Oscillospiraceae bacterium]|jgi:uncharacterized protein|nr:TPM domain-containing protein [Oscillospiraceae bacterium]
MRHYNIRARKTSLKKIFASFIVLLFFAVLNPFFKEISSGAFSLRRPGILLEIPSPTETFYVGDFANVLSRETRGHLLFIASDLYCKTGAQLVFVTISDLEGRNENDYALELGRKWGVGTAEKNNGVVILVCPSQRKVAIAVGDGLEGRINDAKAGRFIDEYAKEDFKNGNWDEGAEKLYTALAQEIASEYHEELDKKIKSRSNSAPKREFDASEICLFLIAAVVFFVVAVLLLGPRGAWYAIYYIIMFVLSGGRRGGGGGFGDRSDRKGGGTFSGGGASRKYMVTSKIKSGF